MSIQQSRLTVAVLGLVYLFTAGGHASAAEIDYELRAGVAYSDNIERTATNEIDTGAAVVGVRLRGAREEGRLQFAVSGDVAYNEYFDSGVDGEVVGSLFADSHYDIVPETVRWNLAGSFTQIRESLLRPSTPSNRDDLVTFSTGPTIQARFGDAFEAELESRFTRADYTRPGSDSDTLGARLVLGRRFSERNLLGVGAAFDDVTYDSAIGLASVDFDRREVFLRWRTAGARTTVNLDVGAAKVAGPNIDDTGTLVRLEATRRLTPFFTGYLAYTQEFPTSEGSSFVPGDVLTGGEVGDGSILTAAPRETKNIETGLRMIRPRTTGVLAYTRRREAALVLGTGDRSVDGLRLTFSRALSPRSTAGVFATYTMEEVAGSVLDVDETVFGAEVSLTFGRNLGLDLRIAQGNRDGQTPADEYSELSAGIFLRWGRISGATGGGSVTPTAYLPR